MPNVMDYLEWRGDLDFAASPFNEVDNFICSIAGTPDFGNLLPEDNKTVPIGELMAAYEALYGEKGARLGALESPHTVPMLRRLPGTVRFRNLRLGGYVSQLDTERGIQFSAVTLCLPDGSCFVAFRGTDDTLAGWKEDFMMGVQDVVPAQTYAAEYLNWAASAFRGPLRVGGHSKGGNLALYAAMHCDRTAQERLVAVYSNDGPGFFRSVAGTPGFEAIRERVRVILPQHSTVGVLLEPSKEPVIVESDIPGMWAHDGFHWQVKGPAFVRCPELSRGSRAFGDAMRETLERMDMEQREAFVDSFFDVLGATGAVTLTDLTEHKLRQAVSLVREGRRTPEVQKFLGDFLELMVKEYAGEVRDSLTEAKLPWRKKEEK